MGLEQGRPQQFFMPDKGTGSQERRKGEQRELQQAIQELRKVKLSNILSTEPKLSPSSHALGTQPHSQEIKQALKEVRGDRKKSKNKQRN